MNKAIDVRPFPNVGNSPFYKEYSVGAMLPTGMGSTEGWGTKLAKTPIEEVIKRGNKKIDKADGQPLKGDDATTRNVIRRQMHDVEEVACLMEAEIMAYGQRKILTKDFFYDENKIPNCIVTIQGYPRHKFRGKSELIVFKGNKIFCEEKKNVCKFPGGGWDPNESSEMAAIREAQEEALMNVKNVHYVGTYINIPEKMSSWMIENIPEGQRWQGYYVDVYVGEYDSEFKGIVNDEDKDDIAKNGKFVTPNSVWKKLIAAYNKCTPIDFDGDNTFKITRAEKKENEVVLYVNTAEKLSANQKKAHILQSSAQFYCAVGNDPLIVIIQRNKLPIRFHFTSDKEPSWSEEAVISK